MPDRRNPSRRVKLATNCPARFCGIERVTRSLAELGLKCESDNPVTSLMTDSARGLLRTELLKEKIFSAIVEIKTRLADVPVVLRKVRELSAKSPRGDPPRHLRPVDQLALVNLVKW